MSLYLGTQLLAGVATNTISNAHDLFDFKWTDHLLTDMSWLRADTFSWQDGTVYTEVYNHLVADYNGGTSQTETVGSYTITYVLATDGHKITTDETNVANIYNESGVAWYYIVDTTNQRFKLPRENPAREVLGQSAPVIGNGTPISICGSSTTETTLWQSTVSGTGGIVVGDVVSSSGSGNRIKLSQDPTKSGMIADLSETTGIYKGKQYLYFYVGQFSQSATEQTAGLNSELFNGKADVDLSNAAANASASEKETIVGCGIPDYTAGVSITSGYVTTKPCLIKIVPVWNGNTSSLSEPFAWDIASSIYGGSNKFADKALFVCDKGTTITFSNATAVAYPLKGVQNA